MIQKILFFFFVIVIAFFPGGIFISVFLLALYYLVPLFLSQNSKEEKDVREFTFRFNIVDVSKTNIEDPSMKSYSNDTLEKMK